MAKKKETEEIIENTSSSPSSPEMPVLKTIAPEKEKEVTTQPQENVSQVEKNTGPFYVTVESTMDMLIQCIEDRREIIFEAGKLPNLSEDFIRNLPYKIAQKFFVERQKEKDQLKFLDPKIEYGKLIGGSGASKIDTLRKRRGYHQTWRTPDQYDDSIRAGYTQIRENKRDGNGNFIEHQEPGYENGEVIKILGRDNKPELIAMEIPLEVIERHNQAVSNLSNQAYSGNKEALRERVDRINSEIPGLDKEARMTVVDSEVDGS